MDIYSASKVWGDFRQNSDNLIRAMELVPWKIIQEVHTNFRYDQM